MWCRLSLNKARAAQEVCAKHWEKGTPHMAANNRPILLTGMSSRVVGQEEVQNTESTGLESEEKRSRRRGSAFPTQASGFRLLDSAFSRPSV
jgi:hypothetical protein